MNPFLKPRVLPNKKLYDWNLEQLDIVARDGLCQQNPALVTIDIGPIKKDLKNPVKITKLTHREPYGGQWTVEPVARGIPYEASVTAKACSIGEESKKRGYLVKYEEGKFNEELFLVRAPRLSEIKMIAVDFDRNLYVLERTPHRNTDLMQLHTFQYERLEDVAVFASESLPSSKTIGEGEPHLIGVKNANGENLGEISFSYGIIENTGIKVPFAYYRQVNGEGFDLIPLSRGQLNESPWD